MLTNEGNVYVVSHSFMDVEKFVEGHCNYLITKFMKRKEKL
jgi:hypothetical protein